MPVLIILVIFMILCAVAGSFTKNANNKFLVGISICIAFSFFWSFQPTGTGHDIDNYYNAFITSPHILEYTYSTNYGYFYHILMSLFNTIGLNFNIFLFFTFLFVSVIYMLAFKKLSTNYVYGLVIVLLLTDTFISMIRLQRQGMAVALLFFSFALLFTNKKLRSVIFLPFIASLHITFLPIYLILLNTLYFVKKNILIVASFILVVILSLYFLSAQINIVFIIFEFLNIDGRYLKLAYIYLDQEGSSGLNLGAGFLLLVLIAGLTVINTIHVSSKKNRLNKHFILINKVTSLFVLISLSITILMSNFPVVGRMALYLSPFFALGLALFVDRLNNYEKLSFIMISTTFLGMFIALRIYLTEVERIPFN
ncbi:MAG: EpsG family protein [Candidatus Paceibacterota bacterium]